MGKTTAAEKTPAESEKTTAVENAYNVVVSVQGEKRARRKPPVRVTGSISDVLKWTAGQLDDMDADKLASVVGVEVKEAPTDSKPKLSL